MMAQIQAIARLWGASLMSASVQIAVLVLLVAAASFLLRNSSPLVRYSLWCIVLVRLCLPMGLFLPSAVSPKPPAHTPAQRAQRVAEWRASHPEHASSSGRQVRTAEFRERIARDRRITTAVGMAWLGGSVLIVFIVAIRALCLRRRIRSLPAVSSPGFCAFVQQCANEMGLRRTIQVRVAPDDECPAPAVTALFKPIIILPRTMVETWDFEELKPLLLLDQAHVRRRDISINWLQIVLQTLYFFHPLVWLANWKIRSLREEACDDLSIDKLGGSRHAYSASLLRAIELASAARPTWGAVALAERKSDLVKRLRRVLGPEYKPAQESRLKVACKVLALGGSCLLLSGMVPVQAQPGYRGHCGSRTQACHTHQRCSESAGKTSVKVEAPASNTNG
jgi:beta-lactamase regulating signal transducer with metallopeptidase domain